MIVPEGILFSIRNNLLWSHVPEFFSSISNTKITSKMSTFIAQRPPLPRAGADRAGQFGAQKRTQYHDHGLAHDHGVFAVAGRLLHLERQPQPRDGSAQQAMRDQPSDRESRDKGREDRKQLRPRHR